MIQFFLLTLSILVGEEGVEPSSLSAHDFESCMFANFITRPILRYFLVKTIHCQFKNDAIELYSKTWLG